MASVASSDYLQADAFPAVQTTPVHSGEGEARQARKALLAVNFFSAD